MKHKSLLYLKLLCLLPVAAAIHMKKHIPGPLVIILGTLMCFFVMFAQCRVQTQTELETLQAAAAPAQETVPHATPESSQNPVTLTLSFAGDCTLGTDLYYDYSTSFNAMYESQDAEYFFSGVQDIFAADDLTVVNFEGTLTESTARADKDYAFKGPAEYAGVLSSGSVEAVNLANNHSCDYGQQSFTDTVSALDAVGVAHFGYDATYLYEVRGVKVGLLGIYAIYEDPGHLTQLENNIQSLQNQGADIIVACFHWGLENSSFPEQDQIDLAHAAIDAGAHLVVGHHPHVLQGIEEYRGRYILYSLGNFCFGGNNNPPDQDTAIAQLTFTVDQEQVQGSLHIIPCFVSSVSWINDYRPVVAKGTDAARILEKIRSRSEGLGDHNVFDDLDLS